MDRDIDTTVKPITLVIVPLDTRFWQHNATRKFLAILCCTNVSDCRLKNKFKYQSYLRLLPVSLAFCDLNDTFFIKIRSAEVNLQAHEASCLGK